MKKRNKILLIASSVATVSLVSIPTTILLTSCSDSSPIVNTYFLLSSSSSTTQQSESLIVNKNVPNVNTFVTNDNNGVIVTSTNPQNQYFQLDLCTATLKVMFSGLSEDFYLPSIWEVMTFLSLRNDIPGGFNWSRLKDWPYIEYTIIENYNNNWYFPANSSSSGLIVNKNPVTKSETIKMQGTLKTLSKKQWSFNFNITAVVTNK